MPYKQFWYIESQVIYAELSGNQTMAELEDSNAQLLEWLDSVENQQVHLIMDDSKLQSIPLSLMEMGKALSYVKHENLGHVVLIGEKSDIRHVAVDYLISLLSKLTRKRYIRLKTFEEALAYLKQNEPDINWSAANASIF